MTGRTFTVILNELSQLPALARTLYTTVSGCDAVFISGLTLLMPVLLLPLPPAAPEMFGLADTVQSYNVPVGTMSPRTPFNGITVNGAPLQIVSAVSRMTGARFTVTFTVSVFIQPFACNSNTYFTSIGFADKLSNVSLI
jgi:hypothetical protein